MKLNKIRRDKKGFATALVDFYATVIIVLIIIIFFVVLHFTGENVTFSIQDAEDTYSLETTQIALLYAQTPVETSQGTMTFGKFATIIADDEIFKEEFIEIPPETITFQDFLVIVSNDENLKDEFVKISEETMTFEEFLIMLAEYKLFKEKSLETSEEIITFRQFLIAVTTDENLKDEIEGFIEISKGTMTFRDFLVIVSNDENLKEEFVEISEETMTFEKFLVALTEYEFIRDYRFFKETMPVGEFLNVVAEDISFETQLRDATKTFFDNYCPETLGKQLSIQIVLTQNGEEKQLQSDLACTDEELSSEWIVRSSSDIMIPLQKPGDFGTITISTLEKVSLNPFTYSMPYSEETK